MQLIKLLEETRDQTLEFFALGESDLRARTVRVNGRSDTSFTT
jgi:hypothetical protein